MFQIGEFSRIARISTRQLRHYDELGLLKPIYTDPETGYRYYSASQLPRLNRILALKELGLTLDQVVRLLDDDISAEEIRGMLLMRKSQIEQTLRDEFARVQSVEERLLQIEEKGVLGNDDVVLKMLPPQRYLSIRQVVPSIRAGFALIHEMHRLMPLRTERNGIGKFALLFYADSFDTENVDLEMGFLLDHKFLDTLNLSEGRTMTIRTVPAVQTMATIVGVGIARHIASYGTLGTWIEKNNYQIAGPSWEIFIEPFQPGKEDEAIIEIQLPVIKIGNAPVPPLLHGK